MHGERAARSVSQQFTSQGGLLDKSSLIELMEDGAARLSLEGRQLWEEWEFLVVSAPELESRMAREYEIIERIFELPAPEQIIISRLAELLIGLRKSDEAEGRGESGEEHRVRGVIQAAWLKDQEEGRTIYPDMTLDQAVARLKEHG
jgi:hypothetical protein